MCCGRGRDRTYRLGAADSAETRPRPCASDVRVGPDAFVDRWGPVTPLQVRGWQTLHRWCLVRRGSFPLASRAMGL